MRINPTALKAIREKDGLSQAALAQAAGTTQPYLSQLESGVRVTVSAPIAKSLAQALRVPLSAITLADDEPEVVAS